jgi:6-phosphofructokinase 1
MSKIAVLTSGGDSPGMNAAVMAVARSAALLGMPLVGIKRGYNGLLGVSKNPDDDFVELTLDTVLDIADLPGTYLRTARCEEFKRLDVQKHAADILRSRDISGLVVIGGDGSFMGANALCQQGVPCIGIPGTIDNDLFYSETSLGFDTSVNACMDAVRSIRATSRSHDRPAVVEVMGRHCGSIAMATASATGAEIVIVPEVKNWHVGDIAARLNLLIERGNTRATIIVAEGAWKEMSPFDVYDFLAPFGLQVFKGEPMTANRFASVLKYKCNMAEVRATIIGYVQRGYEPSANDAMYAFEWGSLAVELLSQGISNQVVGLKNGRTFYMPIEEALQVKRPFNHKLYNMINAL